MWLYRAYSGNLYHGGELVRTLPSFTQGDTITCILDMEAHTISFAKNDKVWPDIHCQHLRVSIFNAWCVFQHSFARLCYSARSQSWHLKEWWPLNCTPVCCSTAVILARRYKIFWTCYRLLLHRASCTLVTKHFSLIDIILLRTRNCSHPSYVTVKWLQGEREEMYKTRCTFCIVLCKSYV